MGQYPGRPVVSRDRRRDIAAVATALKGTNIISGREVSLAFWQVSLV